MDEIRADSAYFIKLGRKGMWEEECILHDNTIKLGFTNPLHSECLAGEWGKLTEHWLREGRKKGKATGITNQIRTFYESNEKTLWITFFRRKMYWCFAEKDVIQLSDGTRIRKVKEEWKNHDIKGSPLTIENLSGKLTKVQGFKGTICSVKEFEYLIRRLNNQKLPEVQKTEKILKTLKQNIEQLIQNLTWKDFELLTDLIFTQAGWQRISTLGKTEKAIDLVLMSPVTGDYAFVQVKSKSNLVILEKCIKQYRNMKEQYSLMYFVSHTTDKSLAEWQDEEDIKFWNVKKLSNLVVDSGLISWLIKKVS